MNHIQNKFEGSRIHTWEIEHGIVRYVSNGCEYVRIADIDKFNATCAKEDKRHKRQYMMEMQERAYMGGE